MYPNNDVINIIEIIFLPTLISSIGNGNIKTRKIINNATIIVYYPKMSLEYSVRFKSIFLMNHDVSIFIIFPLANGWQKPAALQYD